MSLVSKLIGFGLRQVIGDATEYVTEVVEKRFTDHSQTLPKALATANDRAWQAVGIALAGDGFLDQIKVFFATADDKGIREQVRQFLQSNPIPFAVSTDQFRRNCLADLQAAKKAGRLSAQNLSPLEVARQTATFKRYGDPKGMIDGAEEVIKQIADDLSPHYPNLAELLRQRPANGPPLLVAAYAFFFRREVETNQELARGLIFSGLWQLYASQEKAFGEVNKALISLGDKFQQVFEQLCRIEITVVETHRDVRDIQVELQRLSQDVKIFFSQSGMQKGEVKPQYSFSIRSDVERTAVKQFMARFRQLPPEQQKQAPPLLSDLGKLQFGSGDFDGARQTFQEVSQTAKDATAQAEGHYNAYRAALEAKKCADALASIQKASSLDAGRFAPFLMERYEPKRILGAGGFGTAFLCHDHYFNAEVVVKTLHDMAMERNMADVFREAQVLRQLHDPAIIGVRDCSYADPIKKLRPYIVMDYFPGGSLATFVQQRGTLSPTWVVDVARQIAQGMQAAHQQNILHRDLKPDNVLVRKEGDLWKVKIIDFGLAFRPQAIETSKAGGSSGNTIFGDSVAGTIKYAPPEQMGESPGVKPGPYSDVYSFGKLCCYALFKTTEPKRRQWSEIPDALAEMLEQCTEPELTFRLPTFEAVLRVLQPTPASSTRPVPAQAKSKKDQWGYRIGTNKAKLNAALLAAKTPLSMKELAMTAGLGDGTYYNHLNEIIADGHVTKTPDGKYQLAERCGLPQVEKPKPAKQIPTAPESALLPIGGPDNTETQPETTERPPEDDAQEEYTFLFITKPEYTPERVESGECGSWSCGKDTRQGDLIFVYVTGEGIRYKWRAVSDAEPDATWRYVCDVAFEKSINPAITIQEIKSAIRNEDWGAPFVNFRGFRTIRIPNAVVPQLVALRK